MMGWKGRSLSLPNRSQAIATMPSMSSIFAGTGSRALRVREPLADLESGEYVYVRAVQADGGAAWSSPFFVD